MARYTLIIVASIFLFSCKNDANRKKAGNIIREWTGKEIRFPENVNCLSMNDEADCPDVYSTNCKILFYIDSSDCTNCRTQFHEWKRLISESDMTFVNKPDLLFFFHLGTDGIRELKQLLRSNDFERPVFIDAENKIMKLNNLPKDPVFQCFLLDGNNRVVMVGNPVNNPVILELYKKAINETRANR